MRSSGTHLAISRRLQLDIERTALQLQHTMSSAHVDHRHIAHVAVRLASRTDFQRQLQHIMYNIVTYTRQRSYVFSS